MPHCIAMRLCWSMQVLMPAASQKIINNNELFQCQVLICLKDNKHAVDSNDWDHLSLETLFASPDRARRCVSWDFLVSWTHPSCWEAAQRGCTCTHVNNLWPSSFNKTAAASEAEATVCTDCLSKALHALVLAAGWWGRWTTICHTQKFHSAETWPRRWIVGIFPN